MQLVKLWYVRKRCYKVCQSVFVFWYFLAFLDTFLSSCQLFLLDLTNFFHKLSELWYQLKLEAEFMQFRICEIKTDHFNQFSGQDSKEAIWYLLSFSFVFCSVHTLLLFISPRNITQTSWPNTVFQKYKTTGHLRLTNMSSTAGLIIWKSFLVLHQSSYYHVRICVVAKGIEYHEKLVLKG